MTWQTNHAPKLYLLAMISQETLLSCFGMYNKPDAGAAQGPFIGEASRCSSAPVEMMQLASSSDLSASRRIDGGGIGEQEAFQNSNSQQQLLAGQKLRRRSTSDGLGALLEEEEEEDGVALSAAAVTDEEETIPFNLLATPVSDQVIYSECCCIMSV